MSNQLLFVGGFPSGGTDLLKTVLNAHPAILLNGEMPLLHTISKLGYQADSEIDSVDEFKQIQSFLKKIDVWKNLENIDYDFKKELVAGKTIRFEEFLKKFFSKTTRQVWGNKTPQNTENMDLLYSLFPKAKFLIITRDVRDVCLSWHNKWRKDLRWCASKWNSRMRMGLDASAKIPKEQTLFINYESLITNPLQSCTVICDFLNIPFSERMLSHDQYTDEHIDGKLNYGQKIIGQNFDKWKTSLSKQQIRRIEEIAFDSLTLFGYELSLAKESRPISKLEKGLGIVNDVVGSVLIGNTASKQNSIIKRLKDMAVDIYKTVKK